MEHVFQCQHDTAIALKKAQLAQLEEDLYLLRTSKAVRQSILAGLQWWLNDSNSGQCPKAPGFGSIYGSQV